jgi:hypothetical protein
MPVSAGCGYEHVFARLADVPAAPAADPDDATSPVVDAALLRRRLGELAGHIHAAHVEMIELLAQLDDCDGWTGVGLRSIGHWASIELGLDARATTAHVRAAHRLRQLPAIAAASRAGELGSAKVELVTRVAEPDSDADWLDLARKLSVGQLRRTTRAYQRAERERGDEPPDPDAQPGRRRGIWLFDEPDGLVRVTALLEADDAAVLRAALNAQLERNWRADQPAQPDDAHHGATETAPEADPTAHGGSAPVGQSPGPETGDPARRDEVDPARQTRDPIGARRADALVDLLRTTLHATDRPDLADDSTEVIVHVDLAFLTGATDVGRCHTNHGDPLPRDAARRAACDAVIRPLLHDDGHTLDLGRSARTPNRALRRALARRDDNCCTFPGCTSTVGLAAHHIRHWTDQGPTDLDNLTLLCRYHHKLHHEGGYRVVMVDGRPQFHRPDGRRVGPPGRPPPDRRRGFPALRDRHDRAGLDIAPDTARARDGGGTDWSLALTLDALFSTKTAA